MEIKTKQEMYGLLLRGRFGNGTPRFRNNLQAYQYMRQTGLLTAVRVTRPGGPSEPNLTVENAAWLTTCLLCEGYESEEIIYDMMAPDQDLTIQGYVMNKPGIGWVLEYSTTPGLYMREGMKYPKHVEGLTALLTLKHYMGPSDYDDLVGLFQDYPDSVIEFTCYKYDVGDCPRRNTIIWEVRNY